jgi:hypothetical protein
MSGKFKRAAKRDWDLVVMVGGFVSVILAFASRVDSDEAAQIIIAGALAGLIVIYRIRSGHSIKEDADNGPAD